jgi:riboflavin kinase/FMN adenylyltransferase
MRIVHSAAELETGGRKTCLAIGFFDGVHLGHQQLIRQTCADARQHEGISLGVTFDCHPNAVVAPDKVPPLIYSLPRKLTALEAQGLDALLLIHFDREFSLRTGDEFVRTLVADLGRVHSVSVGANFLFGHRRSGDVALLKRLGADLKFNVHGTAAVALDGKPVSSTRIREAIAAGELDAASQMLGRPYSIFGLVTRGDRIGTKLGFPTANLEVTGLVLPPRGVYVARVQLQKTSWPAVVNIGLRPTLERAQPALRVEAHLLGYHGDLYGKQLDVVLVEPLRKERKFASLTQLQDQIAEDVAEAKRRL